MLFIALPKVHSPDAPCSGERATHYSPNGRERQEAELTLSSSPRPDQLALATMHRNPVTPPVGGIGKAEIQANWRQDGPGQSGLYHQ